ncbi:MAG: hypothetical protein ACJASL_000743 [Paraglaciecola sp.]
MFALIILIRLNYQVLNHRRHNKQLQVDMAQTNERASVTPFLLTDTCVSALSTF